MTIKLYEARIKFKHSNHNDLTFILTASNLNQAIEKYMIELRYQFSVHPNSEGMLTVSETDVESLQKGFFVNDGLQGDYNVMIYEYYVQMHQEIPQLQFRQMYQI